MHLHRQVAFCIMLCGHVVDISKREEKHFCVLCTLVCVCVCVRERERKWLLVALTPTLSWRSFLTLTPSYHRASLNFSGPVLMSGKPCLHKTVIPHPLPLLRAVAPTSPASNLSFPPLPSPPADAESLPAALVRKQTLHRWSDETSMQRHSVNCGALECQEWTEGPERETPAKGGAYRCMWQMGSWKVLWELSFCAGGIVAIYWKNSDVTPFVKGKKHFTKTDDVSPTDIHICLFKAGSPISDFLRTGHTYAVRRK